MHLGGIAQLTLVHTSTPYHRTNPIKCCGRYHQVPPVLSTTMSRLTAISSNDDLIFCRFNEIRVITGPSSHIDGIVLSARVETCIKLHISFYPGSSAKFLKIPKTPSVHSDDPALAQSLKFSLEVRRASGGDIIQAVCSKCKGRKDQATLDIVDFRAQSTTVTIQSEAPNETQDETPNRTANIEFFIKCYATHHGVDHHAFR